MLKELAAQLPSVDHAFDELIGRANQVDVAARAPSAADELHATDAQLRDAEVREHALGRELASMRRRRAELEARSAAASATPRRAFPWLAVAVAFAAGLAAMFAISRLALRPPAALAQDPDAVPEARPATTEPPAIAAPPRPTVTPIDPPSPSSPPPPP